MMTTRRPPDDEKPPLYTYKCKDAEYEQIKDKVRTQMSAALSGRLGPEEERRFAAWFCVYGAETFRRRHEGGPWAWETIFSEIGHALPDSYQSIYKWVETGLELLKRPLLQKSGRRREFLVTLACEGGLPLLLLRRENTHLSRYFRELLTAAAHRVRHTSQADARKMAPHIAARYLPASLRHDVVFQLSGDLIQSIIELQEKVHEATDPIASLDRLEPQWRDRLPLSVEDHTVEALLRNLMGEAKNLAQTERQHWRWRCFLTRRGESWSIERHLELPKRVTGASLQSLLEDWEDSPARLRVLLQTPNGPKPIAVLTRHEGTGDQMVYLCEGLRREIRLEGREAEAGARLFLSQGSKKIELPSVGGQELGPLPWVFIERGSGWEMCSEGSVRCREASVRMLAPDGGHCVAADVQWEELGQAPDFERTLYQIAGTAEWKHSGLGICKIRCASQEASEEHFLLRGDELSELSAVFNLTQPFLGMPTLWVTGQDGIRRINNGLLEWRPVNPPESDWRTDAAACAGKVWIRYRDTDGALRFRRQVEVVPTTTRVEVAQVGAPTEEGLIRLSGLPAVRITVPERAGCQFRTRAVVDGVEIACLSQENLSQFSADLHWPDGRALTLTLPFPRWMAAFVRAGRILPPKQCMVLDRLAAVQAVVQTPNVGERFYLKGRLRARDSVYDGLELWESLPATSECIDFDLHRIQDRLGSMMAATDDLDAFVALRIVDQAGTPLAELEIARFDVALKPDPAHNRVILPLDDLERLSDDWGERITVRMLPLWEPSAMPTELNYDNAAKAWMIPDESQPGPWWILGYDADWARFRPLLWIVEGEKTVAESSELVQAVREPDPERRQEKLRTLVNDLAADAEHADWTRIFDYLQLTRTYPASSIDLFRHLIGCPEAMVMGLLKSGDEEFNLLWSLSDQLPFSWYLVPVTCWHLAAKRYFDTLRAGLGDSDPDGRLLVSVFEKFRQRVAARQGFFKSVCDWIGECLFPEQNFPNNELTIARRQKELPITFIRKHEQKLQSNHDSEEEFPYGPNVMQLTEQPNFPPQFCYDHLDRRSRPVRCAPFIAAQISLDAQDYSKKLLFELRQLRDFDQEWFDHAFAWALCIGLAGRPTLAEGVRP